MRNNYFHEKPQIWRAGAIPYIISDTGEIEMLFMIPSTTEYNKLQPDLKLPQIAKGRVEKFEQPLPAAIRECAEELGLCDTNIVTTLDGGVVLGRTYMFAFQVADKNKFTRFSAETESVTWMTYDEFMSSGRELHKPVVDLLYTKIIEQYFAELV